MADLKGREDLRSIADGLAVDSRKASVSCVDLAHRIEQALLSAQREIISSPEEMNEKINDGGPAFPHKTIVLDNNELVCECGVRGVHGGLTKREWFAGMALQGYLAAPAHSSDKKTIAGFCYEFADAMIKEGAK